MNKQILLDNLRVIPDWPIKGVHFRDVTTMFKSPECIKELCDDMYDLYKDKGITKIVGIESRGFVLSSAAAYLLNAGFPARPFSKAMPKNTVSIQSRSTKTLLRPTT